MRYWSLQALGIIFFSIGLAGIIEWWILVRANPDGIIHCLMIGCGDLLEWAEIFFAMGVSRAPRLEDTMTRRIVGGYIAMCCFGGALIVLPRLKK